MNSKKHEPSGASRPRTDRLTKKEKEEIYRFIVLVLVIAAILVVMCLVLGLLASKLPIGTGDN